jgi:hypothetical protein
MQDFAQLETLYGPSESKALIGMCGTIVVGQTMVGDTAKSLCEAFGTREVERRNVSTQGSDRGQSASVSFNRDEVPLYKPSELSTRLGLLPDGSGSILLLYTAGVAYELFWPVFDMPVKRAAHVPAMWTRSLSKAIVPDGPDGPDNVVKPPVIASAPGSPMSGGAVPSGSGSQPESEPAAELAPLDVTPFPLPGDARAMSQVASLDAQQTDDGWPFTEPASTQAGEERHQKRGAHSVTPPGRPHSTPGSVR